MTVIGTDAGLTQPQKVLSIRHGMAERYEVVIDFSKFPDNTLLTLKNNSPANNEDFSTVMKAMRFRVKGDATSLANNLPDGWADALPQAECMSFTESKLRAMGARTRQFKFIRTNGKWTINGETWEEVLASNYHHCMAEIETGKVEIWELSNSSGGWFHPVHIHLVDFQVLSRNGSAAKVKPFEKGPKDVVYVGENETVRVAMRFAGPSAGEGWDAPSGRYMMHCHNLVHEDHDMMMQFNVENPGSDAYPAKTDPMTAAPAVKL
jgi:spore coat protein A, manganese oxidase